MKLLYPSYLAYPAYLTYLSDACGVTAAL